MADELREIIVYYYPISLIFETLLPDNLNHSEVELVDYEKEIPPEQSNSLSMVSNYYIYTGPPTWIRNIGPQSG